MSSSSMPFLNPRDICLENHVLNFPLMKSFANLFTVKYSCSNTCVMFGGIFVDKMLLSFSTSRNLSVVCPRKTSYISKAGCFKPQPFPFGLYRRQNDLLKELQRLRLVAVVLQISAQRESIRKLNVREALTRLSLVYQLHWEKFIFHGDRKSDCDEYFIIYSRDWNVFCPFVPLYQ